MRYGRTSLPFLRGDIVIQIQEKHQRKVKRLYTVVIIKFSVVHVNATLLIMSYKVKLLPRQEDTCFNKC